jgi:hypothetical protein
VTKRDRIVVAVVAIVGVLGGFWMLALSPKREAANELTQQTAQQQTRLAAAQAKVAAGEQARRGFTEDYAEVARLGKAVPVGDQVPSLVFQLQSAAARNGVDFRAVTLRAESAGAAAAPTAGVASAAAVAPPGSSVGAAGFPTLPFTFKFEGDFFRMERMLSAVEKFTGTISGGDQVRVGGRLLTVDGFSIGKSKLRSFPYISAAVTATAYVLPEGEGAFAGATPTGPAPVAGATPPAGTTATGGGSGAAPNPTTASVGGVTP